MRRALILAAILVSPAAADSFSPATLLPSFIQTASGPSRDGATAAGAEVSLLGSGAGTAAIACPYVGAAWRISGGGVFSTAATPGTVTPKITFGAGSVSKAISNLLATATNAPWRGSVTVTCTALGASGAVRVFGKVDYATGTLADGAADMSNSGAAVTVDTTSSMPVDVRVTMATTSASNVFRLDALIIERVF